MGNTGAVEEEGTNARQARPPESGQAGGRNTFPSSSQTQRDFITPVVLYLRRARKGMRGRGYLLA